MDRSISTHLLRLGSGIAGGQVDIWYGRREWLNDRLGPPGLAIR